MTVLFQERFDCRHGDLPCGWIVERNSDLTASGIRRGQACIELLSAGNKFIPVTPDMHDCAVDFKVGVNYLMGKSFGFLICFRYDAHLRRGEAVRIRCSEETSKLTIEYGKVLANRFDARKVRAFPCPDAKQLDAPFQVRVEVSGKSLRVSLAGCVADFAIPAGASGKIALARLHFFDVMKILSFRIVTEEKFLARHRSSFSVPIAQQATMYPLYCDVTLLDFGDCMEARLSFRGGVTETEPGEGNYHVARADLFNRPFLKVITANATEEYVVYDEEFVNVVKHLVPDYFYKILHKRAPWPLKRSVRFMKPNGAFDLAVGFESFCHSTMRNYAQEPTETQFNLKGKVIHSGVGISDGKVVTSFLSNPKKRFASHLPKKDPRLKQAQAFLAANHYFIEGETANFIIELHGKALPMIFEVVLEDAYLRSIRNLSFQQEALDGSVGALRAQKTMLIIEPLRRLQPGLYHLRVESKDPTSVSLDEYCAFEVMSKEAGSPPPPIISGLPYLYNSRTETRGLLTDGFDVWQGASMDEPHYLSCANFLPAAARQFQIGPTVHAYGRDYFCWLGTRCLNKHLVKDNLDLLPHADYVNCFDELVQRNVTWRHVYTGWILETFIRFAKKTKDPAYDISALEALLKEGKYLDTKTFNYLAEHHWEQWLDVINKEQCKRASKMLAVMRQHNPHIQYTYYGPAHIYAGHYKGPEFIRMLQLEDQMLTPRMIGFMQYEDYPFACDYGLERGVYFLTACLLVAPESRIYPEIYTQGGIQGCPDGAVYYAHPPFGQRNTNVPVRMTRQVYEFALATAFYHNGAVRYWNRCGFQACGFTRPWFEALLKGWRVVRDFPPEKPLRSPVFTSSHSSRRAHESYVAESPYDIIPDVRNTAAEVVPYAYEQWRRSGGAAGALAWLDEVESLSPDDVDFLVLPPLKGVPKKSLATIRALHKRGVSLLAFEDVDGLEELFGVHDTGKDASVTQVTAVGDFMVDFDGERMEFCTEPRCKGHYTADGCNVLMEGKTADTTIPVLTIKENGTAKAALFTVPPQLVRPDELHERLGYARDSISRFVDGAAQVVMGVLARPEVTVNGGRLIAYHSTNGADVIIVENPDKKESVAIDVTIAKTACRKNSFPATSLITCKLMTRKTLSFVLGFPRRSVRSLSCVEKSFCRFCAAEVKVIS